MLCGRKSCSAFVERMPGGFFRMFYRGKTRCFGVRRA
jgi:hypothetical protein